MAWGDRAAEQYEKDQPSSCLRPDGAKAEMEPLQDRRDFELRVRQLLGQISFNLTLSDAEHPVTRAAGEKWLARFRAELDQLTLMRSAQILDEAEARRHEVMSKLGKTGVISTALADWELPAEIVLDADERRGD